ncbi:MAG: class B sortase [Oscillospiraceae bacterium]|jgi:sortase B|nr:class B sortase [Oscillospiraceae bacterium]
MSENTAAEHVRKTGFLKDNFIPLKTDSKREKTRKILLDISLLVFLLCLFVIIWYFLIGPGIARANERRLTEIYQAVDEDPAPTDTDPAEPTLEEIRVSAEKLRAVNSDYIGWLRAPGAAIELPIVQTTDNDYYLKRNFYRKATKYGNPFADYRCDAKDFTGQNLIIYGHYMKDESIFAKLKNYKNRDVVLTNPIITFETSAYILKYKILAVFNTNGLPESDNGYVFRYDTPLFPTQQNWEGFIKQLEQRTLIKTGVDVKWGDRLITLQTCAYDFDDEFMVVVGRMLRPGESENLDSAKVVRNANPRYPQALCDRYSNGKNAFKDAELWYPIG